MALEVELQAASQSTEGAAGARDDGVDIRVHVIDHEMGERIKIPVQSERDVRLNSGPRAAAGWGQRWRPTDEVEIGASGQDLNRAGTSAHSPAKEIEGSFGSPLVPDAGRFVILSMIAASENATSFDMEARVYRVAAWPGKLDTAEVAQELHGDAVRIPMEHSLDTTN